MNTKRFAICLFSVYLSWTAWCLLMVSVGDPFDLPVVRALARFAALVIPVIAYMWSSDSAENRQFGFVKNWCSGIKVGVLVAGIWAILHVGESLHLPVSIHSWMNVILLSPIAEEILFRCFVIDRLTTQVSSAKAIVISACLFSLIHLPWWWIAGEMVPVEIARLLALMFVYGVVFGLLYERTRSIWASLIPHAVNNLIAESMV